MQFVKPTPFEDAIKKIGDKTPIGNRLNSEEWSAIPLALRERAFFSSTVESLRFLQRAQDGIGDFLSGAKESVTGPDGVTRQALKMGSRQEFVKQMSAFAIAEGMGPLSTKQKGTVTDITSQKRLNLIFDVQTRQAADFGNWKEGMDADVLDEFPAQRFIREVPVKEPRDLHSAFENEVHLKTDLDFWTALNEDFGVPWGPWGWGCGHGVEDVDRDEAEQLGLIKPGQRLEPPVKNFNDRLEASTRGLEPEMLETLRGAFGDQVEIEGETVRWRPASATPAPVPAPPTPETSTLDQVLQKVGLQNKRSASPEDMLKLREELKETAPFRARDAIKTFSGNRQALAIIQRHVETDLQEFLTFIPPALAQKLPKLDISVRRLSGHNGLYGMGGDLQLSTDLVYALGELKRVVYHEAMHWVHREGSQAYRDAIRKHFEARTAGEAVQRLPGYEARGKKDKWYEAYAGRVYPWEPSPEGLEIPTRYIEWLTFAPDKMARYWNNPDFRETMLIVLQGLF